MNYDKETNQIIRTVKELFVKNVNNSKQLSELIDKYLVPQELEKKSNAEVSTPFRLRQEMLDKIPVEFWTSKKKVFEPCSGKGGFILDIIDRFMSGLSHNIPDEKERYKTIVEECLYFSDINSTNIFICKLLIDPYNEYNLNYNEGNTLELNIKDKWDIEGFDAVIGNPPYNIPKSDKLKGGYGGRSLWDKFVDTSIDNWLNQNGYLLYVHPPSWRKPEHRLWNKMTKDNKIIYLKCYSKKEGNQIFKCSTLFDYYLLQKTKDNIISEIYGQDKKTYNINLEKWKFLPSGCIDVISKILGTNEVIYSSSIYDTRRKWILSMKNKEPKEDYYKRCKEQKYEYPIIHNMTKDYGLGFVYSNENKGHLGVKKVVLSFGEYQYPYNDYDGKYGMSQICYGLEIKKKRRRR